MKYTKAQQDCLKEYCPHLFWTEEEKLEKVACSGYAIQYLKDPSIKLQLVAVKQHGFSIQFIKVNI